jgi:hypothetical protein
MYPIWERVAKLVPRNESQDARIEPMPHEPMATPVLIFAQESSGTFAEKIVPIVENATAL